MRFLLTITILTLLTTIGRSQPYGNEWINYNQTYYKFPIAETGIHRITYQALLNAGIPLNSITSNQIKIFGKEKEIPLYIKDGGDNSINNGDYIEFYAEKNDGWLDSLLYDNPTDIGNPGYSLYNDTIYYFLTWSNSPSKRFIEESATNFSSFSPTPYVLSEYKRPFTGQYYGGYSVNSSYSSFFSPGEGWGSSNYNGASGYSQTIQIPTPEIYTGSGAPKVVFHAKSNANSDATNLGFGNHHLRWEIGGNNLILHDEAFAGFRQTIVDTSFSVNELSNGNTSLYFKIIGDLGVATDYQSISYFSLKYPRKTSTNDTYLEWEIPNAVGQSKSRIDLTGATLSNPSAYIIGGGFNRKIPFVNDNSTWKGLIPNGQTASQKLILANESEIKFVFDIQLVNNDGKFKNYQSLNLEGAYLLVYNKVMTTSAQQYANYRTSALGGGYNVIMCEINDAWMQYGGGVPKHVLGIRRWANQIYNLSMVKPEALFLVGKGISEANEPNTSGSGSPRKSAQTNLRNLVPSYGNPSSDHCITAKWNGSSSFTPAIPTGRIAAQNNNELLIYLEKIKIYEAAQNQNDIYNKPNKEWQKQVLHFGGGSNSQEQNLLKSYLNSMKSTIEGTKFGGNVTSFFKTTTDPFNPVQTMEVNNYLENGVSIMNFFGHAHSDGFDQNVDDPQNWGNTGRYPFVIGNGCYTGDIYLKDNTSTSENFVLIENLGAIAFLSTSTLGFTSYLNLYSSELYRQISFSNYGTTIGKQINNTIQALENSSSGIITEVTTMQYIMHGDPAIKINWHREPEIDLTAQDVFFTPNQVDLTTDSITANIVLTNLGRSITDTFTLSIRRIFPTSNIDSIYHILVPGLDYKDTIRLTMPLQPEIAAGMNQFHIQADIPSFIPELYDEYGNNEVKVDYFIDIGGIIPVWPHNYAVVPHDSVVLKASTINPIAAFNTYRFEIDTTDLYNSPFKKYSVVNGLGGVKEVFPSDWKNSSNDATSTLVLEDSVSYYWRVAVDSSTLDWREHSFQYIPKKRGWGQAHFFQFKNGGFFNLEYDRTHRKRNFQPQPVTLGARLYDNASTQFHFNYQMWTINGFEAEYGMCQATPQLIVGVVNPSTFEAWGTYYNGDNPDHQFGNLNNNGSCVSRVEKYFLFRQNRPNELSSFINMIENEIPDGHFIVIYTGIRAMYNQWQDLAPDIFTTFSDLGATGISPTATNRAFILITEKGNPASTVIKHATTPGEIIELSKTFTGAYGEGVETSTIIGPSLNWRTLYWKQSTMENPTNDSTRLVIRGLDYNKQVQLEIDTVFTPNDSILNLNNIVPAAQYPYMQLVAKYFDQTTITPAQVNRWHVLYDDVPEAAIDGTSGYTFLPQSADSLQEGAEMAFAVDIRNISDLPMDSLLVHYWITDKNQIQHAVPYARQDSLRVSQTLRDTIRFSSLGLAGQNTLWMEVNPYVKGPNNEFEDQPELAHFNNLLQIPFHIGQDDINPILDVTFDGEHILNGDIISPFAEIVISLKDDNPFLVMDADSDTTNFGIYLTNPEGVQKRIPFIDKNGNQIMQWIPADASNLRFKIIYSAEFEEGGTYELLVQGSDRSGNLSGKIEYRIQFNVILESSITHMMNYPNPFSTSTRFVFTLTGTKVPDDIIIQIMTVTGRIVREITEEELGFIHIGRNITEYAWDGRDEYGDPLANGVYLYRVKAQIDGEDIKHRESGADKHFKKSWGKMYLMR